MTLRCACIAAAVLALSAGGADAFQAHDGSTKAYATPGRAPFLDRPIAYPPGDLSAFSQDLDLPEPSHYSQEVMRVVQGGFFPATIAELAVVWPGQPVQVMLMRAQRRETLLLSPPSSGQKTTWVVTSRKFSSMSWEAFSALRDSLLATIQRTAAASRVYDRDPRKLGIICTDDGGGSLAYGSGHVYRFTISLSGCGNDAVRALEQRVLTTAEGLTKSAPEALPTP